MKKTIIDLFEASVREIRGQDLPARRNAIANSSLRPMPRPSEQALEAGAGLAALGDSPRGQGRHTGRRQQRMDHLRTGAVLRRGGQRAAVGEARRVERPAVPHAARRGQGRFRVEIPAAEDPPHPRRTAAAGACDRPRTHSAGIRGDGLRYAQASGPRIPRQEQGGVHGDRAGDPERRLRRRSPTPRARRPTPRA